mmetsp:Transcript_9709/g.19588  ORF Transcript_9709/g.19588 Transcript_9709/m.19588 type:complete len:82 (-) Transcript_9709:1279-1524(-)
MPSSSVTKRAMNVPLCHICHNGEGSERAIKESCKGRKGSEETPTKKQALQALAAKWKAVRRQENVSGERSNAPGTTSSIKH